MANDQDFDVVKRVNDSLSFGSDGKPLPISEMEFRSRTLITVLVEILLTKQILTNAELDNLLFRLDRMQAVEGGKKSQTMEGDTDDLHTNHSTKKPELPPSREHAF